MKTRYRFRRLNLKSRLMLNTFTILFILFNACNKHFDPLMYPETRMQNVGISNEKLWDPVGDVVYIDPWNSGDHHKDGSIGHPFSSFDEIRWQSGKVYALKRGTMIESGPIIIEANNVILASYGEGERPVIRSKTRDHAITNHYLGGSDIIIRDVEVHAPHAKSCILFHNNSRNVSIIHTKLHGSEWGIRAPSGVKGLLVTNSEIYDIKDDGIFIKDSENIEISQNYIHHVNRNWKDPSTPETIAGGDGIQLEACNHWHVHHNLIDRRDSGNKFCFISNNPGQNVGIFEHNELTGPRVKGASVYIGDGNGIIIRYNHIKGPSNSPVYTHGSNIMIYGNIFENIQGPLYASHSAEIYNNLFYQCRSGIQGGRIIARNNIFDLSSTSRFVFKVTDLTESNNLFVNAPATKDSFTGKPAYQNAEGGNFRLSDSSDCIDRGMPVGIEKDMDGQPVPLGGIPDIGPFEYNPDMN